MWTALVLGVLIVGGIGGYIAWSVHMIGAGAPWWPFVLGLPVAYLLLPFVFTCVWMLMGRALRAPRPPGVELTFAQRLRLFGNEFAAIAQSAPKMVLYRVLMPEPPPAKAAFPVLLLHGVGCNAGVWAGFRRYLDERGLGPVYALSYGPPLASIERFAVQLGDRIAEIRRITGAAQVIIVAHSMGGLVARTYLFHAGGASVRRLITVGTPHAGSMHAWLMNGAALVEMRPHSAFLKGLNGPTAQASGVPMVSLWSWHDSMVTPQDSSRLPWGDNIVISGVAHNALLNDHGVWAMLADEIVKARTATTAGNPTAR